MFNRLKNIFTPAAPNTGDIIETSSGFVLIDETGTFVQKYGRRRDAVRGANRRGITLVA